MINDFQHRLRQAITDRNITASELSRISGVGKSDISNYLNGVYVAKQDKCYMLAKALNVDPGWLFFPLGVFFTPESMSWNDDQNSYIEALLFTVTVLRDRAFRSLRLNEVVRVGPSLQRNYPPIKNKFCKKGWGLNLIGLLFL